MALILAAVLLTVVAGATVLRCSLPVAAPTSIFGVTLVLYAFGCVGLLGVGFWVVVVAVAVTAAAGVVLRWRRSGLRDVAAWVAHPALVVYLLMLGVYALRSRGLRFEAWDEFSHWGRVVAAMVAEDALPTHVEADLIFASYAPGLPTWEYFLANLRGDFLEADVFVACQALLFALVLPFARHLSWRRPGQIALVTLGAALLMVSFFPLDSVLIDPALAVTFGYCAALALLGSPDHRTVWRHLGPALVVLVLLKTTGALLALIAVAVIAVRAGRRRRVAIALRGRTRSVPLWLAHVAVGVACVVVGAASWQLVLAVTDTAGVWQASGTAGDAVGAFLNRGEAWRIQTTTSFIGALSTQALTTTPVPMSYWTWFALSLALLVVVDRLTAARRGRPFRPVVTGILLGGALLYTAGIWFAYLTTFSEYEATNLASFPRYLKLYWFAVLFVCAAVAADRWLRPSGRRGSGGHAPQAQVFSIAVLVTLLSVGQVPALVEVLRGTHAVDSATVRSPFDGTAAAARGAGIGAGDRVWILDQYSSGFGFHVLSYELLQSDTEGWSLGEPLDAADIWTRDLTVREWSEELESFDYVLVHHTEPAVEERYGSLFEDPSDLADGSVFEVTVDGDGTVELVPVTTSSSG